VHEDELFEFLLLQLFGLKEKEKTALHYKIKNVIKK